MGNTYPNKYKKALLDRLNNPGFEQLRAASLIIAIPRHGGDGAARRLFRLRLLVCCISAALQRLGSYRFEALEIGDSHSNAPVCKLPHIQVVRGCRYFPQFTEEGWRYCLEEGEEIIQAEKARAAALL
jgi:hypothetical protein